MNKRRDSAVPALARRRRAGVAALGLGLALALVVGLAAAKPGSFPVRILDAKTVLLTGSVHVTTAISCTYDFHQRRLACVEPPFARGSRRHGIIVAVQDRHKTVYIAGCERHSLWSACQWMQPGPGQADWHHGRLVLRGALGKGHRGKVAFRVIRIQLPPK